MDILQHLHGQADQVEVARIKSESTSVAFEANKLKTSQVEQVAGIAVRIVKDGRLGFAASSDASATGQLITNVLASAAFGDAVPIHFPAPQPAPKVKTYDKVITDLPVARLVEIAQEMISLILQTEPEARVDVSVERGVQQLGIENQAGLNTSFERSPLSMSVSITRIKGDDVLMVFDIMGSSVWQDDYLAGARHICSKLKLAQRMATIRSGRMPVLLGSGALALGFPLLMGLNGKNVFFGISPMQGKIGEQIFDSSLTVVDDPTIDGKSQSAPYDDEGVPHRRNVLIERGVLKGFYYDLKTAAQAGVTSTGNGSRSLFSPPGPSQTNLLIEGGARPLAAIIAGIDEGLIVEDVLGLGQGNVISGAFSNPVALGFKIEKGEIVGRVKDVSIAGNIYGLLKNVMISHETEWVYGSFSLPSILAPDMNVVAKG